MLLAQVPEDADGCKDPQLLARKSGCIIESCSQKDFDSLPILTGREQTRDIEGATHEVQYRCAPTTSGLAIVRNVATALRSAGFQLLFEGKDVYDEHAISGRKDNAWLTVRTNSEGRYTVSSVIGQQLRQELTAQWSSELAASGRAIIYGIEFDTALARLREESTPVLEQVLALLRADPASHFRIEGHTDASGPAAINQKLSADRAASVMAWLIARGIPASRLTPVGMGSSKPLEPNTTAAGRARNRRVELVRAD